MRISRFLLVVALTAALAATASCGRKGKPEPPDDADYPRQYPAK
jgi:predicted small lipoprotein YifL